MRLLLYFTVAYTGSWSLARWSLYLVSLNEGLDTIVFVYSLFAVFGAVLSAFIVDTVVESLLHAKRIKRQVRNDDPATRSGPLVKGTLRIPSVVTMNVSTIYSLLGAGLWVIIGYIIGHPFAFVGNAPDFITIGAATGVVISYRNVWLYRPSGQ